MRVKASVFVGIGRYRPASVSMHRTLAGQSIPTGHLYGREPRGTATGRCQELLRVPTKVPTGTPLSPPRGSAIAADAVRESGTKFFGILADGL